MNRIEIERLMNDFLDRLLDFRLHIAEYYVIGSKDKHTVISLEPKNSQEQEVP
jgi:hypothetical protein